MTKTENIDLIKMMDIIYTAYPTKKDFDDKTHTVVSTTCPDNMYHVEVYVYGVFENIEFPNSIKYVTISYTDATIINNVKFPNKMESLEIKYNCKLQSIINIQLSSTLVVFTVTGNEKLTSIKNVTFPKHILNLTIAHNCELHELSDIVYPTEGGNVISLAGNKLKYIKHNLDKFPIKFMEANRWYYSPHLNDCDITYITENTLTPEEIEKYGIVLQETQIAIWYYNKHITNSIVGITDTYSVREVRVISVN